MLVFIAFGFLAWIAFLLAALILTSIFWALCNLVLGITYLIELPGQKKRKMAGARRAPPSVQPRASEHAPPRAAPPVRDRAPSPALAPASPDIWPKWTPAHRRYVDEELTLWLEQFEALNSRR